MKKVLFIINPKSGTDRIKALQSDIEQFLNKNLFSYETVFTEHAGHGTQLTEEGIARGFGIIVAVGGDGSVNDVVKGLYGSNAVLGIIPKGSGNGLARSLKIPLNQQKAIRLLNYLNVQKIDVGSADGQIFVSNAGVGFDVLVTDRFRSSEKRGFLSYIGIILKSIWTYSSKEWQLEIDGIPVKRKAFMLTAAIAQQLGYGFKIAPQADLSDGLFDLVTIRSFPNPVFAAPVALFAFLGLMHKSPFVSIQKVKQLRISHPDLQMMQIDGEAKKCATSIEVKVMEKKINVIALQVN